MLGSRPDAYGSEYFPGYRSEPGVSGITAGASFRGYETSFEDPNLHGHRRDELGGIGPGIPDVSFERPNSLRRSIGPPIVEAEAEAEVSNVLFVDGLPTDCTRREIGHLFRPFIGFRELRVVHKEPRRRGDKAMVLCFVEFTEAKCALTALEALQGYKFDDKKPDSPLLKIHFAHFPFRLPSERNGPRV
ncbi:protein maternally expressed gene 5 [Phtheirospermum japonicum]|uniref:Protein maternally expressed gene 5 n=1 Tax=Phtheirospermum japonicum TaxID=374723 RepID=A0A830D662_9LAMI|nr:protein maternally expressed gene 5 [Phtheirospermum japonicum]